jgi:hypothetical protein
LNTLSGSKDAGGAVLAPVVAETMGVGVTLPGAGTGGFGVLAGTSGAVVVVGPVEVVVG